MIAGIVIVAVTLLGFGFYAFLALAMTFAYYNCPYQIPPFPDPGEVHLAEAPPRRRFTLVSPFYPRFRLDVYYKAISVGF